MTVEEHAKFVDGLTKLGKGNWRGIVQHFVQSRTPTQVCLITRDRSVELKSGAFQSLGPKLPRPTPNIVSVVHALKLPTLTPR